VSLFLVLIAASLEKLEPNAKDNIGTDRNTLHGWTKINNAGQAARGEATKRSEKKKGVVERVFFSHGICA
jgi:hypothetical protein